MPYFTSNESRETLNSVAESAESELVALAVRLYRMASDGSSPSQAECALNIALNLMRGVSETLRGALAQVEYARRGTHEVSP